MSSMIWTIGHSTRTFDELAAVLAAHRIEAVVDVRRFPGSRRLPHFGRDQLEPALDRIGVHYRWVAELGGRRSARDARPGSRWRHPAFAAYGAHIGSEEFGDGLHELMNVACGLRTTIMCAEVLWWRCHRRIIADVLTTLGHEVVHLRTVDEGEVHRLVEPARVVRGRLTYE